MPTSPAAWEAAAVALRRIYADAETRLLERIARRLERGIDEDPFWAEQKLQEVRYVQREIEELVTRLERESRREIETAVVEAYEGGALEAARDIAEVVDRPLREVVRVSRLGAVESIVEEAVAQVRSTHLRILRVADDIYRRTIAEATARAATGAMTRREAAQMALNRFADAGITGFIDRAGRRWDIASYTEMATRTATGRAAIQGHIDRLQANGYDLVIVSDSPDECPLCRPWEGRVLSLSGATPGYPTLAEAQGSGLFHANCTHTVSVYVPGLTRAPERRRLANPEGYEKRQQQRYNERMIRKWKRREAAAITDEEREFARRKVREWQAIQRKHLALSGREFQRDYARESITRAR